MIRNRTAVLVMFLASAVITGGMPATGFAQPATTFHDLQGTLTPHDRLAVTQMSGVSRGQFLAISDETLRIWLNGAEVSVPATSISRIERLKPRTWKGALLGLGAGVAAGALHAAATPCVDYCRGTFTGGEYAVKGIVFGGIGAAVGAFVGSHKPARRIIYQAP